MLTVQYCCYCLFFFLLIRQPPDSKPLYSSAASDLFKATELVPVRPRRDVRPAAVRRALELVENQVAFVQVAKFRPQVLIPNKESVSLEYRAVWTNTHQLGRCARVA